VTDIIAEITAASQEQASGIDQVNKAVMSMDETTQQNAALVEETTSAAQSMKEQAKGLMQQMEAFKIKQLNSQPVSHSAIKSTTHSNGSKAAAKRPVREARLTASDEIRNLAAVTTGTGKNYRAKEAEFEEF
jgi:methyl-accepting chemotaxis protein